MSPGDLDLVMSDGLGMRYAFIGPLETMHLNAEGRLPFRHVQGGILCGSVLSWFCNGHSSLFLQLNRKCRAGDSGQSVIHREGLR